MPLSCKRERRVRLASYNYRKNFDFTQTWICNSKLHDPNKRKVALSDFHSLILSMKVYVLLSVWRCHGIPCSYLHFFCLESTVKSRHGCGNYFRSDILKVTWWHLCSKFFLNNYKAHWQQHLKDTLQSKFLLTWINIRANYFLSNYHEMKMSESSSEIISRTKIRTCSSKNIGPKQFTFFFFSQIKLVFKFNLVLIE